LSLQETAAYIAGRIRIAGGDSATIFTREAVQRIYEHSRGIPRAISVICDNALVSGFALDARPIESAIVVEVCREFGLVAAGEARFATPERPAFPPAKGAPGVSPGPLPTQRLETGGNGSAAALPASPAAGGEGLFSSFGARRRRFFDFFWNRTGGAR
jgi:hypothetical protein